MILLILFPFVIAISGEVKGFALLFVGLVVTSAPYILLFGLILFLLSFSFLKMI